MNDSKLIQYHEINIPHEKNVVFINLKPVTSSPVSLRVYVSFYDYPTPGMHTFSVAIPCKFGEPKCSNDNYTFSFNASDTGHTGIHYIGIHYYVNSTYGDMPFHKRARKSVDHSAKTGPRSYCKDGGRRKKRSCVGLKDPPPIPTPKPVILLPEFNASTDLNYTLVVSIGSCFYWSEEKEYWTEEGCKVRVAANISK